ncbi:endonuclease III domain-containing protein [Glaesserella sp.]|uniref:endonuclease III domain-containing protein n=1 Tax=Glaesserella sp. TaxID=2094731 RepID=UPI0035A16F20
MESANILNVLNNLVLHYGEQHWWQAENRVRDCVSMILIQRSTQQNVEKALENLTPYLTFPQLAELNITHLQTLIRPAGFYQQKAHYLKNITAFFANFHYDLTACHAIPTDNLRDMLLEVKGIGFETADVMLLYLFERKVFIADQYAMRLFKRLNLGDFHHYETMRKALQPIVEQATLKQCQEWHACIDEHGKAFRRNENIDESFLINRRLSYEYSHNQHRDF